MQRLTGAGSSETKAMDLPIVLAELGKTAMDVETKHTNDGAEPAARNTEYGSSTAAVR